MATEKELQEALEPVWIAAGGEIGPFTHAVAYDEGLATGDKGVATVYELIDGKWTIVDQFEYIVGEDDDAC